MAKHMVRLRTPICCNTLTSHDFGTSDPPKRRGEIREIIGGMVYMRTMVLVYLPTKLGDFLWANVGKYSIHGAYG